MRYLISALVVIVALAVPLRAGDLRFFEDAALRAVHFIDDKEGWVAGDDGNIWHTLNGGLDWERQPTKTRGSLRSIQFLTFQNGWIVGREELPNGAGSVGVLLYTDDGGNTWQQTQEGNLPGLHSVHFLDAVNGYVVGEGSENDPSGVFMTTDGGRSWKTLPGPRVPGWLGAHFSDAKNGVVSGAWDSLALVRDGEVIKPKRTDRLEGRAIRDIKLNGQDGVAVGQGGLILFSDGTRGADWKWPKTNLSPDVLSVLDFHAVASVGKHVWIAGRPGSMILHTPDRGNTWEMLPTRQPLPLHALHFINERQGWAVGEVGTVLTTDDGGKTWKLLKRGMQRAAVLFLHSRPQSVPLDTVAMLGGSEGYMTAVVRVTAPDPNSSALQRSADAHKLSAAVRRVGGGTAETLWQFPVPQYLGRTEKTELLKAWDRLHGDAAAEQLLRQLVLTMRMWQPDVIVTDNLDEKSSSPVEAITADAVIEAYKRAVDPKAFPEQLEKLGLSVCKACKLYNSRSTQTGAQVVLDTTEINDRFESTPREFVAPALALMMETSSVAPGQRFYRLSASSLDDAEKHRSLMQGTNVPPGGTARRKMEPLGEMPAELRAALQARRNLQALSETPIPNLTDPTKMLAQLGTELKGMPDRLAPAAAFAFANQMAANGQWTIAREAFLLMVERYPAHPLSADAYRWLIRYASSSEARQRQELGQFLTLKRTSVALPQDNPGRTEIKFDGKTTEKVGGLQSETLMAPLVNPDEVRQWHLGALQLEPHLAAYGRMMGTDPSVQFCLNSSRRAVGRFDVARNWYTHFVAEHRDGPWRELAQAELWLSNRVGTPPRPVLVASRFESRPFLDGKLDDPCWKNTKPLPLQNAVGDTKKEFVTDIRVGFDKEFLYLGIRCEHPPESYVAPVKPRPRDADVRPYDRISLLLDLDRDYTSSFNLHVDQRGCPCDECWGDLTWNPRWFISLDSDKNYWQIEAAIPLLELTSNLLTSSDVWAFNIVRTIPGRGVQAYSTPADVLPRLEGMGLLMFEKDTKPVNFSERSGGAMPRVR